jgi:tRNA nucleotidyltransferase (CCA-adding enzyme)
MNNKDIRLDKQKQIYELLEIILAEEQCFTIKDLAVSGNDLLEIGYKQGKQLGEALQGLLDCVIANEVDNNKEELLQLAIKWLNSNMK